MRVTSFGLLIALLAGPTAASAQSRPVPFPTIDVSSHWQSPGIAGGTVPVVDSGHSNHVVPGLLIGAALGIAAGWVFYDALCEAVDNDCNGSRLPLLMRGGFIGGALGALIGIISEE